VVPLGREHIAAVAALHYRALGGLLTMLGPAAIAPFYRGYLDSPRCIAFVDVREGALRGFVLGSSAPAAMRRDALRANLVGIAAGMARALLWRPRLLRHVLSGVSGMRGAAFDPTAPELTYVAVREDARGNGSGGALLRAFGAALRRQGVTRYELSVEASNRAALAFYESHGLRQTGSYRQFETTYHRYACDVPPEVGTETSFHGT
jgi:ribosomal protein S18 acetylase RimI-like enzyme